MGFANDILGGAAALIRAAIKSPNYVAGLAGWSINKNGSAEFNSLTIRGTFNGTDFILNRSGLFFYSSTPAPGVPLIGSWAPVATTDPFGTAVPEGIQKINSSGVGVALTGTTLSLPGIGSAAAGFLDSQAAPSGSTRPQTLLSGPANNNLVPQVLLAGESTDASALPLILLQAFSLSGGVGTAIAVQINGSLAISPNGLTVTGGTTTDTLTVSGQMTATGGTPANPSQISTDTWNTMTLLNSWTAAARITPKYRLTASPPKTTEIIGSLTAPAGIAAGQIIWNVPAGYTVSGLQSVVARNVSTNAAAMLSVVTGSPQTLQYQSGAVAGNIIDFHAFLSQDA